MYPVSDEFLAALRVNHTVISKAELWTPTSFIATLQIDDASVSFDRTAAIRRSCSIAMSDSSWMPRDASDPMWPAGNEVRLFRGIRLPTGDEYVPLGVFKISKPGTDDDGIVQMGLTGYDRSRQVQRARFTQPYIVALGTRFDTAIKALIQSRLPWLTDAQFNFSPVSTTTPLIVFDAQSDPWAAAQTMAASVGCDLYFDVDGICVMRPEPDANSGVINWTFSVDADKLLKIHRDVDDENAYNGWIVNGESSSNAVPAYAEAWDDDPSSPTYYLGPYGMVPKFYTSSYITTDAQALTYAQALRNQHRGFVETVNFDAICNPALSDGDIAKAVRDESLVDVTGVVESGTIPLSIDGDMTVNMRTRTL